MDGQGIAPKRMKPGAAQKNGRVFALYQHKKRNRSAERSWPEAIPPRTGLLARKKSYTAATASVISVFIPIMILKPATSKASF